MSGKNKVGKNAHWTNKYGGRIVDITTGRNGRQLITREVTAPCRRCTTPFTFTMTTQPERHCPGCKKVVVEEKRIRDRTREANKRRAMASAVPEPRSRVRKIKYAGHPSLENVDD
jgi:hypothetical protein